MMIMNVPFKAIWPMIIHSWIWSFQSLNFEHCAQSSIFFYNKCSGAHR